MSQFRIGMLNTNDKLLSDFLMILKRLYVDLVSWGCKNKIKIVVALFYDQDEDAHEEKIKFYTSGMDECGNVEYSVNNRKKMLSYKLGMESEVVVAMDSTLSYELFGCGSKLLFCTGSDKDFLVRWGGVGNLSKMPDLVVLHQLNSNYFNDKLDELFFKDYQKYLMITENARSYYMKCDQKPAHQAIKDDIEKVTGHNGCYLVRNKAHV